MKRALPVSIAAALLATAPALAQPADELTLFERFARKVEKNPALGKLAETPPGGIESFRWMVGTWDATSRRYPTRSVPERIQNGTRQTRIELKGWCLASIDDIGDLKAASLITEDPYSQKFARLFLSRLLFRAPWSPTYAPPPQPSAAPYRPPRPPVAQL